MVSLVAFGPKANLFLPNQIYFPLVLNLLVYLERMQLTSYRIGRTLGRFAKGELQIRAAGWV